jgi:hypothetical protein
MHASLTYRCVMSSLAILFLASTVCSQQAGKGGQDVSQMSDEQLASALAVKKKAEAIRVIEEVMKRGERMIRPLTALKGNHQCFYGAVKLGDWRSDGTVRVTRSDEYPCFSREYAVTVQTAALFLISAIYHDDLEFAEPPILCDFRQGENEDRCSDHGNTSTRIATAWAATEKWIKEQLDVNGLDALRIKEHAPLDHSGVSF